MHILNVVLRNIYLRHASKLMKISRSLNVYEPTIFQQPWQLERLRNDQETNKRKCPWCI